MDWCRHDGIEFNIDLVSLYLLLFPIQQHKFCCQLIIALYRSNNDLKPSGALALASYFTALTSLQMLDLKWGLLYCVCLVSFYIQVSPWSCEITPSSVILCLFHMQIRWTHLLPPLSPALNPTGTASIYQSSLALSQPSSLEMNPSMTVYYIADSHLFILL